MVYEVKIITPPKKKEPLHREVLSIGQNGSLGRTQRFLLILIFLFLTPRQIFPCTHSGWCRNDLCYTTFIRSGSATAPSRRCAAAFRDVSIGQFTDHRTPITD